MTFPPKSTTKTFIGVCLGPVHDYYAFKNDTGHTQFAYKSAFTEVLIAGQRYSFSYTTIMNEIMENIADFQKI